MNKKRILALFLVIAMAVLILSACGEKEKPRSITADNLPKGKVLLSSLSDGELTEFLAERGITIPEELADLDVHGLVVDIENDIAYPYGTEVGWVTLGETVKKIHATVKSYYGFE